MLNVQGPRVDFKTAVRVVSKITDLCKRLCVNWKSKDSVSKKKIINKSDACPIVQLEGEGKQRNIVIFFTLIERDVHCPLAFSLLFERTSNYAYLCLLNVSSAITYECAIYLRKSTSRMSIHFVCCNLCCNLCGS